MQFYNFEYHTTATTQQVTDGRLSVNRFLFENPQRLAFLVENYQYDGNKQWSELGLNSFLWSRVRVTQKALRVEILRLVIDLLYKNSTDDEKRTAFLISNWLVFVKKFERPFKLLNSSLSTAPLVSIWCLYQYILKGTPVKAVDEYAHPVGLDDCCVCLELPSSPAVRCDECSRVKAGFMCEPCYNSLQVIRCPCCRSESIHVVDNPANLVRVVSFMHNRREYTRNLTLGTGFTLCYFDGDFQSTPVAIETLGQLCIKAVAGYFENFNCDDSCDDVYEHLLPEYRFLFPHHHNFKEYVYGLPLEKEAEIMTKLTGLNDPRRARDFYCDHIGNVFSISPLDFDSLHVERISFGLSPSALFINLPEGCALLSLAKSRETKQTIDLVELDYSFYIITP